MTFDDFEEHISEMKAVANQLIRYTTPIGSEEDEHDVDCLKHWMFYVDGYALMLYLSRAYYRLWYFETFEIMSTQFPFLPKYLICKIAARVLGGHELRYSEEFRLGRKVYIWNVGVDLRGRPLPLLGQRLAKCRYENFSYRASN